MELMEETIEKTGLNADEVDSMQEQHEEVVRKYVREWLRYSEYVTLEIDTTAGTCVVVKP
jgi:hypothetical protein